MNRRKFILISLWSAVAAVIGSCMSLIARGSKVETATAVKSLSDEERHEAFLSESQIFREKGSRAMPKISVMKLGDGYEATVEPVDGEPNIFLLTDVTTPPGKVEIFFPGDKIMIGGMGPLTRGN